MQYGGLPIGTLERTLTPDPLTHAGMGAPIRSERSPLGMKRLDPTSGGRCPFWYQFWPRRDIRTHRVATRFP